MKLTLLAASAVAAVALGAGTASAQYPVVVPHRNHYHVVPAYRAYPSYGYGYGFRPYAPGVSFNFSFGSPRVVAPAYYGPAWGGGYRPGWGGGYGPGRWHR